MNISIAICTMDRSSILEKSLQLLINQIEKFPKKFHLLIVDQSHDKKTKKLVNEFQRKYKFLKIHYSKNLGQGIQVSRNKAIKTTHNDVIVFIDDDINISKNWVTEVDKSLRSFPKAAIIGGKILPAYNIPQKPWLSEFAKEDMSAPFAIVDKGNDIKVLTDDCILPTANLIIRKKYFNKIGFFNKVFAGNNVLFKIFGGEDIDFVQRALNNKLEVVYCPDLIVYHNILPHKFEKKYLRWRFFQNGMEVGIFNKIHGITRDDLSPKMAVKRFLLNINETIQIYLLNKQENFSYEISLLFDIGYVLITTWYSVFNRSHLSQYKYSCI